MSEKNNKQQARQFISKVNALAQEMHVHFVMSVPDNKGSYVAYNMPSSESILTAEEDLINYLCREDRQFTVAPERIRQFKHEVEDACDDTYMITMIASATMLTDEDWMDAGDDEDDEADEEDDNPKFSKLS